MSTTASIRSWFVAKLAATTSIPEIAYEGVKYERRVLVPFVRLKLLPAESLANSIGTNHVATLRGLAQIDVFYPMARGVATAEVTAQSIITEFAPAVYLDGAEQIVIDNVWTEGAREDPTMINVPVFIRWRAFKL